MWGENLNSSKEETVLSTLQPLNEGTILKEESVFGEVYPNQWSYKVKKLDSIVLQKNNEMAIELPMDEEGRIEVGTLHFLSIKKTLRIKADGKAHIIFNVGALKKYSITIINEEEEIMKICIELSPDNVYFIKKTPYLDLLPKSGEIFSLQDFCRFVRVKLFGSYGSVITIFLQGQK